ncbi:MAG: TIGR00366 family protein [Woeseiaceae bacterium]|nr:TIGR00366 family protein [Woeseiaceae bacterium]
MLRRTSDIFVKVAERWMPDPLVIAIFLTAVSFVCALLFTDFTAMQSVEAWGNSYWDLLRFTAQMILILALAHVLANTRPVNKALVWLASFVRSAEMAYVGITMFASAAALLSWGLGLILPAVLSLIVANNCRERGIKVHFPLLVACGYCGTLVGMQGLSASIPLVLNTPNHFLQNEIGLIGLDKTIFSWWSMSIVLAIALFLPQVMRRLAPDDEDVVEIPADVRPASTDPVPAEAAITPSQKLENARWVTLLLAGFGGIYVVRYFAAGGELQLDSLNMIFVVLGLAFTDSPRHYIELLCNAARVAGPFLIQYPLYSGLMGLIADSGLGALIVSGFVAISSTDTLSIWTFFSAAFLNLFIPSAGGQWAVQGPIVTEAAMQLGADIPRVAMSVAIGEVWTNAIQPLYAVPVLAIAGLHIRDIMGYCVVALLAIAPIYLVALAFF